MKILSIATAGILVACHSQVGASQPLTSRQTNVDSMTATHLPEPHIDPFYKAPSNLSSATPGEVFRSRSISSSLFGNTIETFQLYYRTTDGHGKASGTVTTVFKPARPVSPSRVVSYQVAEDSLNIDCTPSWSYASVHSPVERPTDTQSLVLLEWALRQGYYVVSSDFEGPESGFLSGPVEGQGVLDGIRAAKAFLELPEGNKTSVVLTGYSGGGHSSAWTSTLAEKYAPELNIVGAAFGGTPVDLRSVYDAYNSGSASIVSGAILFGLANAYPQLNATLDSLATTRGKEFAATIRSNNYCVNVKQADYSYENVTETLFKSDPFANPVVNSIFAKEALLANIAHRPIPVPKFPRFQWHGMDDSEVPYRTEAEYVREQCAGGADIRFLSYPGKDHVPAYFSGMPGAYRFIKQAFEGTLEKVACGKNVSVPALGSVEANEFLGYSNNILLQAMVKHYDL